MSVSKVLVIYSKDQLVPRRTIVIDHEDGDDSHYAEHLINLHSGEGVVTIPIELYNTFDYNKYVAYLEEVLGPRKCDRCIVVCPHTKTVKHVIRADPLIDNHLEGEIVNHPNAEVGDLV